MPRPADPHSLIYAPSDPADMDYPDWVHGVGDRAVFRISGLYDFRVLATRNDSGKGGFANPDRLHAATERFNELGWDRYCTVPRNLTTHPLSVTGVRNHLRANEGRRTRLSLYSALIIVLMLENLLEEYGIDADIYDGGYNERRPSGVKIVPYIFDVPDATASKFDDILSQAAAIKQRSGQRSTTFLNHMCSCEEMFSERTSKIVREECGLSTVDVVLGERRARDGQPKKSCCFDRVVYPMT